MTNYEHNMTTIDSMADRNMCERIEIYWKPKKERRSSYSNFWGISNLKTT